MTHSKALKNERKEEEEEQEEGERNKLCTEINEAEIKKSREIAMNQCNKQFVLWENQQV